MSFPFGKRNPYCKCNEQWMVRYMAFGSTLKAVQSCSKYTLQVQAASSRTFMVRY